MCLTHSFDLVTHNINNNERVNVETKEEREREKFQLYLNDTKGKLKLLKIRES